MLEPKQEQNKEGENKAIIFLAYSAYMKGCLENLTLNKSPKERWNYCQDKAAKYGDNLKVILKNFDNWQDAKI